MTEQAPRGLFQWARTRVVDWVFKKLLDVLVSAGAFAAAVAWIKGEWACIRRPWCEVSGWSLGLLIAFTVIATYAALFCGRRWYQAHRELRAVAAQPRATPEAATPQFHDIEVLDEKLNLRWFIRRPPHEWLHWRNVARTVADATVRQVLDGPFDAVDGCNAPLVEIPTKATIDGASSPQFDEKCTNCGRRVFRDAHRSGGWGVSVWSVRAYALEELQRMQRNGTKLPAAQWRPAVVLENPEYWKLMLTPDATEDDQQQPTLVPLDVYLEVNDDNPNIEYKRKLRIVLRNCSSREIIVREPEWQSDTGDIPARPHALRWDREPGQGWTSKKWGGPGHAELTAKAGQVFCTWIGLTPSASEDDVRQRMVTHRLGTLVVRLTTDGQSQTQSIRL